MLQFRNLYFERQAREKALFVPEFETSNKILETIAASKQITESELNSIVSSYNEIVNIDHYDGSGWFDFKLLLSSFFKYYGYMTDFNSNSDLLEIRKINELSS